MCACSLRSTDPGSLDLTRALPRQTARVLTSESTLERPDVRVCTLPDIKNKIMSKKIVANDRNGNTVRGEEGGWEEEGSGEGRRGGKL